jgi:LacI family repressor for deo operon, udp, cdd, tsx, nupC, and nupG
MKNNFTLKLIAEELGLSISTVSRALNGNMRIGLKTRERIQELAKKNHYIKNPSSKYLRGQNSMVIGVVVPNFAESFFASVITSLEDALEPLGYILQIMQSRDDAQRQETILKKLIDLKVDGVIISLAGNSLNQKNLTEIENFGIPIVFFDRVPRSIPSHKVISDVKAGAKSAVTYLKNLNRKRIGLLNGPSNLNASDERLNGYLEGINHNNLYSSPKLIKSCNLKINETISCFNELLEEKIDALIVFNDYLALWTMTECKKKGFLPNKDIVFVSFGNLNFTHYMENPPMASNEQFPEEIGKISSLLLLDLINEKIAINDYQSQIVKTELIIH